MSQLFPTIYVSFDGFQRRQLKQDLLRHFNQSPLRKMGFRLKFSPRTIIDFGTPDPKLAAQLAKQSALMATLFESVPGKGARQNMLHTELSCAYAEDGTQVLLLCQTDASNLSEPINALKEENKDSVVVLAEGDEQELATQLLAQIELALLGATPLDSLELLPEDNAIQGHYPNQFSNTNPTLSQLLSAPSQESAESPALSNLHQHQRWLLNDLELENRQGAQQSIQHCLALYDSDLLASYWRCRLLVKQAIKESEHQELIRRSQLIQRHLQQQKSSEPELEAECYYYQAQGQIGLQDLTAARKALEQALALKLDPALLHQLTLCTLQQLAQQKAPTERHDPCLLQAKESLLQLLQLSLTSYQLSTQQLLIKTPKEKLEIVLLGIKQDLIASIRQLLQQEHQFKQLCSDWELIITAQVSVNDASDLLQKSLWNLVQLGRDCTQRQLTLIQLLSQQAQREAVEVKRLEEESQQLEQHQQTLNQELSKLQLSYQDTLKSRQFCLWGAIGTGTLVAALVSGFWWLHIAPAALAGLLAVDLVVFALMALLLKGQNKKLSQIAATSRALDTDYAQTEDELPEPRAQEGWFDRLAVRRDKLRDKYYLLTSRLTEAQQQLEQRLSQLVQAQQKFAAQFKGSKALFSAWAPNLPQTRYELRENSEQTYALTPELLRLKVELAPAPAFHLVAASHPNDTLSCFFNQAPNPLHCKKLHLLQVAANSEIYSETLHVPDTKSWQLNRWMVAEGEDVIEGQPLVELQHEEELLELSAPKAGKISHQLAREGHDLEPQQAVVELQIS